MGRSNLRVILFGSITVRPMHQPANVVANTLCLIHKILQQRTSILFSFTQPTAPMTFRTNQPRSTLESISAFWELSIQNRAMDLRPNYILNCMTLSLCVLAFVRKFFAPPLSIDTLDTYRLRWPQLPPLSGGGSPSSRAQREEQLLNPHYNKFRFFFPIYNAKLKSSSLERAAPLLALRDKSTYMNGANSHLFSSLLWFLEPHLQTTIKKLVVCCSFVQHFYGLYIITFKKIIRDYTVKERRGYGQLLSTSPLLSSNFDLTR